ncbi:hypothetical protein ACWD25_48170, partial [Streptomyces sp. NPDC002920]
MEPIRVLRPRNTDALAELVRELTELTEMAQTAVDNGSYESIRMPVVPEGGEAETEELPPTGPRPGAASTPGGGSDWAADDRGAAGRERPGPRSASASGPGYGSARTDGRRRAPRAGYASAAAAGGRRAARAGEDSGPAGEKRQKRAGEGPG